MKVSGQLVDIHNRSIYPATIWFKKGLIRKVEKTDNAEKIFILPGLIDAHIHIESSMLTPGAFASAAVRHGTTSVVSDPHEIANVMGLMGIRYMIKDSHKVPLKFYFGAPSCVPATNFESSGAKIGQEEIEELFKSGEASYLAEMMNFPGVVNGDEEVLKKIEIARKLGKKIDGHAPGLKGKELVKYISEGISTDHECTTIEEAKEKISLGMKILIREGSAAKNLESLQELFKTDPENIMLCSDDLHPETLEERHINKIIANIISSGFDIYNVIRSATINPSVHYNLDSGLLQPGQKADFIFVDTLQTMNVLETWINGRRVYERGKVLFKYKPGNTLNKFNCKPITVENIAVKNMGGKFRIIEAFDGELQTKSAVNVSGKKKMLFPTPGMDILKIVAKDRYENKPPAVGFIKGFGLKHGAFASSVAHDSHNIISIGTNDEDIVSAINEIIRLEGGLAVSNGKEIQSLQLNIAGIMSNRPCSDIAYEYKRLSGLVKELGSAMSAPFMTLSFMALLVIPELKLSDSGLFDGTKFCHVPLFID